MANRNLTQHRWSDDEDDDGNLAHEHEHGDDDGDTTIVCPHCDALTYDDAEQCSNCGEYLSREDAPRQRQPLWITVTLILLLIAFVLTIFAYAP